jgi:hypothetical protein
MTQERPDLQFATKELSRDLHAPTRKTYRHAVKVASFAWHTRQLEMQLQIDDTYAPDVQIVAWTDSDWAKEPGRKSTSSGVVSYRGFIVCTFSRTQPVISLSSCEAELYASNMTASEVILARSILQEVQTKQDHAQQKHDKKMKPIIMRMDAASTITALSRPGVGRLKHVDIRDLWLQDQVKMKRLKIVKVPGTENIADLATKYHPTSKLSELQQMIGLVPQSEQQLMMTEQANSNSQTTSKLIIPLVC